MQTHIHKAIISSINHRGTVYTHTCACGAQQDRTQVYSDELMEWQTEWTEPKLEPWHVEYLASIRVRKSLNTIGQYV
jgi:hypothetical protein